jgi:CO dehydrogenase/acetyl-CoA synthase beta subunit
LAKFKDEFPAIVDRVQVTIITDKDVVAEKPRRPGKFTTCGMTG